MSRILITGGAGFIGQATARVLMRVGHRVRILDSFAAPVHARGERPAILAGAELQVGDVRDATAWQRALLGVDQVLHLAAHQDYGSAYARFSEVNVYGTALLFETVQRCQFELERVVVASSQAVYGEGRYRCPDPDCSQLGARIPAPRSARRLARGDWECRCAGCDGLLQLQPTPETAVRPASIYGVSKRAQEEAAFALGTRLGIPTVALRYSIVQGAGQSFANAYSGILRIFTQRLLAGKPPILHEDGGQIRDYVSIQDVVQANLYALSGHGTAGEAYNIGGDRRVTVAEFARLLQQKLGREIPALIPGRYRVGDTRHIVSAIQQARGDLGWAPQLSMEAIVDDYLAWAIPQGIGRTDHTEAADAELLVQGGLKEVLS